MGSSLLSRPLSAPLKGEVVETPNTSNVKMISSTKVSPTQPCRFTIRLMALKSAVQNSPRPRRPTKMRLNMSLCGKVRPNLPLASD